MRCGAAKIFKKLHCVRRNERLTKMSLKRAFFSLYYCARQKQLKPKRLGVERRGQQQSGVHCYMLYMYCTDLKVVKSALLLS